MNKNKLIDEINEAFIQISTQNKSRAYAKYLREINSELIKNVGDLTSAKVKSIVMSAKLNIDDTALLFMILSAITVIVNKGRMTKKEKLPLLPILGVLAIYSIANPKRFVDKIYKVSKGKGLNDNEKKVKQLLNTYKEDNIKTYDKIKKDTTAQLEKSQRKTSTKRGKAMMRDLGKMRKEGMNTKRIHTYMNKKYNASHNVERVLHTELHAQAELAKGIHAESVGLTHKKWKTQGDSRVRETRWHNQVSNKRIPINSEFKAAGLHAMQPGDESLPPKDRIRCRCYLVYD
jgi:DNA-binding transcriptional MerR regulator